MPCISLDPASLSFLRSPAYIRSSSQDLHTIQSYACKQLRNQLAAVVVLLEGLLADICRPLTLSPDQPTPATRTEGKAPGGVEHTVPLCGYIRLGKSFSFCTCRYLLLSQQTMPRHCKTAVLAFGWLLVIAAAAAASPKGPEGEGAGRRLSAAEAKPAAGSSASSPTTFTLKVSCAARYYLTLHPGSLVQGGVHGTCTHVLKQPLSICSRQHLANWTRCATEAAGGVHGK